MSLKAGIYNCQRYVTYVREVTFVRHVILGSVSHFDLRSVSHVSLGSVQSCKSEIGQSSIGRSVRHVHIGMIRGSLAVPDLTIMKV